MEMVENLGKCSATSEGVFFRYQKAFVFFRLKTCFDSIVKPIRCYGYDVWGYQYVEKTEKVHIKFYKQCCLLSQNTVDYFAFAYGVWQATFMYNIYSTVYKVLLKISLNV